MTVLVTGASGLLGHALAHRLAGEGDNVRVLLRKPETQAQLFDGTSIDCVAGSLEDIHSLREAVDGVEEIYHCAATSTDWAKWETFYSGNVTGVENLLSVARELAGLRRFLHVSSTDVYGYPRNVDNVDEDSPLVETSLPYNRSKVMGEQLAWTEARRGMPVTVVRPATIYGPRDKDFVVEIYEQLKQGPWQMPLIAGGNSPPGLLYIDNAVDGIIAAARSDNSIGKAYNLRDETAETWRDFLNGMSDKGGFARTKLRLPFWFAYAMGSTLETAYQMFGWWNAKPLLTRHTVYLMTRNAAFPIDRAKQDFGFASRVSFDEAITECVAWMQSKNTAKRGLATVGR